MRKSTQRVTRKRKVGLIDRKIREANKKVKKFIKGK